MKKTRDYFTPIAGVVELLSSETVLALSGDGADLSGAGVDEENGNENGIIIW